MLLATAGGRNASRLEVADYWYGFGMASIAVGILDFRARYWDLLSRAEVEGFMVLWADPSPLDHFLFYLGLLVVVSSVCLLVVRVRKHARSLAMGPR